MKVLLAPVRKGMFSFDAFIRSFPDVRFALAEEPDAVLSEIGDAEVVFGHLTREQFVAARRLQWVQSQGAGVDWMFSIPEIADSQVQVTNTRGAQADTIAEHAFGLLVALARGFFGLFEDQRNRLWRRPLPRPAVGLEGLTMAVLGFGAIGRALGERAAAFKMPVVACDVAEGELPAWVRRFVPVSGFRRMLGEADVLAVTVPFTEQTRGMIGAAELALMKPTAYLLALSRGGIVQEPALIEALRGGRLAGAGLDVQEQKPVPPDSPLWDAPNLLLTPHCSGESAQTVEKTLQMFADNLRRWIAGQPLLCVVDKRKGY